jgi:hypothetical protein
MRNTTYLVNIISRSKKKNVADWFFAIGQNAKPGHRATFGAEVVARVTVQGMLE